MLLVDVLLRDTECEETHRCLCKSDDSPSHADCAAAHKNTLRSKKAVGLTDRREFLIKQPDLAGLEPKGPVAKAHSGCQLWPYGR